MGCKWLQCGVYIMHVRVTWCNMRCCPSAFPEQTTLHHTGTTMVSSVCSRQIWTRVTSASKRHSPWTNVWCQCEPLCVFCHGVWVEKGVAMRVVFLSCDMHMRLCLITRLLMYGMMCGLDGRHTEGESFLDMATTIDPGNTIAWTMRGC